MTVHERSIDGQTLPLAVDTTAPRGFLSVYAERLGTHGFLKPRESSQHSGLKMNEPYQRGKIPVIFIHGLASDPLTWGSMANDLFVNKDLLEQFQFWTFSYTTGNPFPGEAAKLRSQLVELRKHIDPNSSDPALDNIFLIGHSMGGLVAKMQITTSQSELVKSIALVPLSKLKLRSETRNKFSNWFEFTPSPQVKRTIFIGTPHQGSKLANGIATQLASRMIRQPDELLVGFEELIENNEQLITSGLKRLPNSIDLLRPDNELRQAIYNLPVSSNVALHSIIGVGHGGNWGREQSDGVVPLSSAQHPGVESELTVDAGHGLHSHPDATAEVVRILRHHAEQTSRSISSQSATYPAAARSDLFKPYE